MPRNDDERYYEALRDPDVRNLALCEGNFAGVECHYVCALDKKGNVIRPIALMLNDDIDDEIDAVLGEILGDPEEDDDEEGDEEEEEAPRAKRGKKKYFKP